MIKKIKRKIWWVCFVILLTASIVLIIEANIFHTAHSHQISEMAESIHETPNNWKDIEIDDRDALLFNKDMYITHDIIGTLLTAITTINTIVIIFLLVTIIHLRKRQ